MSTSLLFTFEIEIEFVPSFQFQFPRNDTKSLHLTTYVRGAHNFYIHYNSIKIKCDKYVIREIKREKRDRYVISNVRK